MSKQPDLTWVLGEQELGPLEKYFADALNATGVKTNYHNVHSLYPGYQKKASNYYHRLPRKIDNALTAKYVDVVNKSVLGLFRKENPQLIFVYNDCLLTKETISAFRKAGARVVTLLGDDPSYLILTKKTFLLTVLESDAVIVPDSGWIDGLRMLDHANIIFTPIGTDTSVFHKLNPNDANMRDYGCDILFVGTGYFLNSWGVKRAKVLNSLAGMNFKLFGDKQWIEVLEYFPDLKKHYTERRMKSDEVNIACNCAKMYPVTVNSGVVNGASTRIFDGIASGIFILAEYKSDIEMLFGKDVISTFTSAKDLRSKAEYYLANERERIEMLENARKIVHEKFTLDKIIPGIMEQVLR